MRGSVPRRATSDERPSLPPDRLWQPTTAMWFAVVFMASACIVRFNHPFITLIQKLFAPANIHSGQNIGLQNGDAEMSGNSPGRAVIDPFGEPLTADTLPPADTTRWVPRRKAQVVCARVVK